MPIEDVGNFCNNYQCFFSTEELANKHLEMAKKKFKENKFKDIGDALIIKTWYMDKY